MLAACRAPDTKLGSDEVALARCIKGVARTDEPFGMRTRGSLTVTFAIAHKRLLTRTRERRTALFAAMNTPVFGNAHCTTRRLVAAILKLSRHTESSLVPAVALPERRSLYFGTKDASF